MKNFFCQKFPTEPKLKKKNKKSKESNLCCWRVLVRAIQTTFGVCPTVPEFLHSTAFLHFMNMRKQFLGDLKGDPADTAFHFGLFSVYHSFLSSTPPGGDSGPLTSFRDPGLKRYLTHFCTILCFWNGGSTAAADLRLPGEKYHARQSRNCGPCLVFYDFVCQTHWCGL